MRRVYLYTAALALLSTIYPAYICKELRDLSVKESIAHAYVLVNIDNNHMKCLGGAFSFNSYYPILNFLELPFVNIGAISFDIPHIAVFSNEFESRPFIWSFRSGKFVSTKESSLFIPVRDILSSGEVLDECKVEF